MTLKQFSLAIEDLMRENPDYERLEIVYCVNNAGDWYIPSVEYPAVGYFENNSFMPLSVDLEALDLVFDTELGTIEVPRIPNAICIN